MSIALRRNALVSIAGGALPYDAEVEYLRSTSGGGQAIDTGIIYDSSVKIECRIQKSGSTNGYYFFGVMYVNSSNTAYRWALNSSNNNRVYPQFGTGTNKQYSFSYNVWHKFEADYRYIKIDNGSSQDTTASAFTPPLDIPVYLFGRRYINEYNGGNSFDTMQNCWFSYCKLWKNDVLVRDYIPVRVGTTGYMYDKVSGQLFGNVGTGDFILGSDIPTTYDSEIEYLESTGTQYIDTGLKLFDVSPTTFEITLDVFVNTGNTLNSCVLNAMNEVSPYPGIVIRTNDSNQIVQSGEGMNNQVIDACGTRVTFTVSRSNVNNTHSVNTTLFAGLDGTGLAFRYCKMKLYGCQISKNGVTVRNFKPVRAGTKGYLFDSINGVIYRNDGTGDFILGNDVN